MRGWSQVGGETRLEGDGRLDTLETGERLLQINVQLHGAGDRAYRTRTDPYWSTADLAASTSRASPASPGSRWM